MEKLTISSRSHLWALGVVGDEYGALGCHSGGAALRFPTQYQKAWIQAKVNTRTNEGANISSPKIQIDMCILWSADANYDNSCFVLAMKFRHACR